MTTFIRSISRLFTRKSILAAAASVALVPTIASAGEPARYDRGDRYDYRTQDHHDDFRFNLNMGSDDVRIHIGNAPVYQDRVERVWVEPVYRTACDRVWREAAVQDVCERVWIEPVYEVREVVRYDWGRRVISRERVLVRQGHVEERHRDVVVAPAHWENVDRQELVCAGHWDTRVTRVRVEDRPMWSFGF